MKKILLCCLLVVGAGCADPDELKTTYKLRNFCEPSTSEARSNFILACIKNANPLSDEEPEDWILKCQHMEEDTLCGKKQYKITSRCSSSVWPCMWYEVDSVLVVE